MKDKNIIYDDEAFFKAYADMPRSKQGLDGAGEWRQLKNLFPDVKSKNVLDLGCGYGWHCKYAADQGAKLVVGVDASEKMIAEAELKNSDDAIFYEVTELDEYCYPAEKYDFVLSNLVLHYVENLDAVYSNVFKTLKKGGTFLFNVEHPCVYGQHKRGLDLRLGRKASLLARRRLFQYRSKNDALSRTRRR